MNYSCVCVLMLVVEAMSGGKAVKNVDDCLLSFVFIFTICRVMSMSIGYGVTGPDPINF